VIPVGFASVAVQFRNEGDPDPWYITWGADLSDAGGDYDGVAQTIITAVSDSITPSMNAATALTGVILRVGQDGGEPLTLPYAVNVTGSGTTAKLPQNCALLVSKITTRAGRTGKGRFFVPNVLSEADVNNVGVIDSGTRTDFQDAMNTLLGELEGPDTGPAAPMVLLHNTGAPGGTTPTPVLQLGVDTIIATQRRRLR
jgi:hypothetical protein